MIKSRNLYICHFLPSCRDDKWLCRCKQHDLFPTNTYQFFVKFPSLRESISVCACAANAIKALYTGWGILSATRGDECSDLCSCAWEGVICTKLVQRAVADGSCTDVYTNSVIGLELIGLGLRGHLSGTIGNLTNLQILSITGNPGLTGNLPSEIGSLTNLTVL
jgi:hypothetical protein